MLAESVVAAVDLPAWNDSALDGYAVRAVDTGQAPVRLPVSGEIRAGDRPMDRLSPGSAVRIMTGAPLPTDADAVVRREDTDDGRESVRVEVVVEPGTGVRYRGADASRGDAVLTTGTRLRAAEIAMCAALGLSEVSVRRRPRVGLLSIGDELVAPGDGLGPGQRYDCNRLALATAVHEAGGAPMSLGIAADSHDDIAHHLRDAAAHCDVIVSCAGVSVGDHDHVRAVVATLGSLDVWQVAMKPGRPVAIGNVRGVPFLGLPGNPVSAQVTFELFARPAILALQGATAVHRRRGAARAAHDIAKPADLETFHRACLGDADAGGIPLFSLTGDQSSGRLRSLTGADCLVVLPIGPDVIPAGAVVATIPLA